MGTEIVELSPALEQQSMDFPRLLAGSLVTSRESHDRTAELCRAAIELRKKIEAWFQPMVEKAEASKRAAEATRKAICDRRDGYVNPLAQAEKMARFRIGTWEAEERRKQEEEQRRIQAEADRLALEAREAQIQEAGQAALVADLCVQPIEAQPIVAPPAFERAKNIGVRETWYAEVTDARAFCAAIGDGRLGLEYFREANMPLLNARAKAEREALNIPGVTAKRKF